MGKNLKSSYIGKVLIIFFTMFFVSGCNKSDNVRELKEDFKMYLQKEYIKDEKSFYRISSGQEIVVMNFGKENVQHEPKIILEIAINTSPNNEKPIYDWINQSIEDRKSDMKELGDIVVEYAKENGWANDYYLYVVMTVTYGGCDIVYDYETDNLWIPKCEKIYNTMYEKFNTFHKNNLKNSDEGKVFLLDNELCYEKHGELEDNYNIGYFDVYINEGKFYSYGEEDSDLY